MVEAEFGDEAFEVARLLSYLAMLYRTTGIPSFGMKTIASLLCLGRSNETVCGAVRALRESS